MHSPFLIFFPMTLQEKQEELAYIATLTDEQVCEAYNVDYRHEIIEAIEAEHMDDEDEDDEAYWKDYAADMIIERRREKKYSL